jgi:thiamine-phosphate pyrophosphorylase
VNLPDPPLLVITDRKQASAALVSIVTAVLNAGCRWISVREKDLAPAEQVALMRELSAIAHDFGAVATLHGATAIAQACGASGLHLPENGDPMAARAALGTAALIGISVHADAQVQAIDPTTVDYAIAGPVFVTQSKPSYGSVLGPSGFRTRVASAKVPLIAIGGIAPENVADVISAGAAGIAVMGGVMRAADPGAQTRALLDALAVARG